MRKNIIHQRSEPLYVETPEQTISLVEESASQEWHIGPLAYSRARPHRLFVIDRSGVRALAFSPHKLSRLALVLLALLALPIQYLLLKRRRPHER